MIESQRFYIYDTQLEIQNNINLNITLSTLIYEAAFKDVEKNQWENFHASLLSNAVFGVYLRNTSIII